jgi:hypothetical protein
MKYPLSCKLCGKEFHVNKARLQTAKYCSFSCRSKFNSSGSRNPFYGKTHTNEVKKAISESNTRRLTGKRSMGWKGGRVKDGRGYIRIYKPEHPKAVNGYVKEHRLIVEEKLGRYLFDNEVIHHINGDKHDNRPENLVALTRKDHINEHKVWDYPRK